MARQRAADGQALHSSAGRSRLPEATPTAAPACGPSLSHSPQMTPSWPPRARRRRCRCPPPPAAPLRWSGCSQTAQRAAPGQSTGSAPCDEEGQQQTKRHQDSLKCPTLHKGARVQRCTWGAPRSPRAVCPGGGSRAQGDRPSGNQLFSAALLGERRRLTRAGSVASCQLKASIPCRPLRNPPHHHPTSSHPQPPPVLVQHIHQPSHPAPSRMHGRRLCSRKAVRSPIPIPHSTPSPTPHPSDHPPPPPVFVQHIHQRHKAVRRLPVGGREDGHPAEGQGVLGVGEGDVVGCGGWWGVCVCVGGVCK